MSDNESVIKKHLTDGEKTAILPQFNSSLLSPQSLSPSQTHRLVIHLLLLHVNSSSEHVN